MRKEELSIEHARVWACRERREVEGGSRSSALPGWMILTSRGENNIFSRQSLGGGLFLVKMVELQGEDRLSQG